MPDPLPVLVFLSNVTLLHTPDPNNNQIIAGRLAYRLVLLIAAIPVHYVNFPFPIGKCRDCMTI